VKDVIVEVGISTVHTEILNCFGTSANTYGIGNVVNIINSICQGVHLE